MAEAFRTTASATGPVSWLTVYLDGSATATELVAGLYADAAGKRIVPLLAEPVGGRDAHAAERQLGRRRPPQAHLVLEPADREALRRDLDHERAQAAMPGRLGVGHGEDDDQVGGGHEQRLAVLPGGEDDRGALRVLEAVRDVLRERAELVGDDRLGHGLGLDPEGRTGPGHAGADGDAALVVADDQHAGAAVLEPADPAEGREVALGVPGIAGKQVEVSRVPGDGGDDGRVDQRGAVPADRRRAARF